MTTISHLATGAEVRVAPKARNAALDRARTFLTLVVLLHHSVIPYTHFGHTDPTSWIGFDLTGSKSNRDAIGAQVRLFWDGREQLQEVSGGSGYSAQNQHVLHFGLGKSPKVEKAVIRWPSGLVQTIEAPAAGRVHKIEEPK